MTNDNRSTDRDSTEPVEVQHYGPAARREPAAPPWTAGAPAWSTSPPPAPVRVEHPRGLSAAPLIALALVAGIISGALSAVAVTNLGGSRTTGTSATATDEPGAQPVSEVRIDESSAVIDAVNDVAPAVVLITARSGGLFGGGTGTGSGVIYHEAGWILTNRHVVQDAESLVVALTDDRTFEGTVYGIDTLTDLAIVKIEGEDLPVASIGTSANLEPGQVAIAIGNPLG
jgi:serine protease Do